MTEQKLVAGHVVTFFNGREHTPDDEAVIHIEGDEDSDIELHCPNAPALAGKIVKAVNSHDALMKALEGARQAIEYTIHVGGPDPGGVLLKALNKCDSALAGIPAAVGASHE